MSRPEPLDQPYSRYLGVRELYELQGEAAALNHHDEFLFRTVHLSSELWLRLIAEELRVIDAKLGGDDLAAGLAALRRARAAADQLTSQLGLLESMPMHHYHAFRGSLGDASGLQSPGFGLIRKAARPLIGTVEGRLAAQSLSLATILATGEPSAWHMVIDELSGLDAALMRFLHGHLQIALRFLGAGMDGTGGQGVDYLRKAVERPYFPQLWQARIEAAEVLGAARSYGSAPQL